MEKQEVVEENLVKKTCRELGVNQSGLAELIGVSRVTINEWANNKTPIPKWGFNSIDSLLEIRELNNLKKSLKSLIKSDRQLCLSLNKD